MFWRSHSFCPRIVLTMISMPIPSGYCGASRSMVHSGRTYAGTSNSAARATINRERVLISIVFILISCGTIALMSVPERRRRQPATRTPRERHVAAARAHAYVTLHLLVQRRAEVGAVERIDTLGLRHPQECACVTR